MSAEDRRITIGSVVAGYRVEGVLGAGQMGTVYLARHPELPRHDALKILSEQLSANPQFRSRFVRETAVAARLQHPNIVSIYSRGITGDGQPWIAMQFVEGTDADRALRGGTMTPARAVHIIGQVAQALDYAHHCNVSHRNVKPANFLLSTRHGTPEHVLLGDFGIARGYDDAGLTATGPTAATVACAAPEVLAGLPFDHTADVYSLGCSLFQLLTGSAPFVAMQAGGPTAVTMAHLHHPPPRVTDRVPALPPALDAVIATAMAKHPGARFRSAGDLAAAAAAALRAPPGPPAYPPALPARRRRRRRTIGVFAAAALLVAGTGTAVTLTANPGRNGGSASTPAAPASTAETASAPVPGFALRRLLLPVPEIDRIMGGSKPKVTEAPGPFDVSGPVENKECVGAYEAGQSAVYDGTGYTGVYLQEWIDQNEARNFSLVDQALIAYPSADRAQDVLAGQVRQWEQCANRTITVKYPGRVLAHVTFGPATVGPDGMHLMVHQLEFVPQRHCEHVLTVRNNVVIDVSACSAKRRNQGPEIARLIAERVASA